MSEPPSQVARLINVNQLRSPIMRRRRNVNRQRASSSLFSALVACCVCSATATGCADAAPPPLNMSLEQYARLLHSLRNAHILQCNLGVGTSADWGAASPPQIRRADEQGTPFATVTITGIGSPSDSAQMTGNNHTVSVGFFTTDNGLHFLERNTDGVGLLTVFADTARGLASREYAAVSSDHSTLPLIAITPSQYHGKCRIAD